MIEDAREWNAQHPDDTISAFACRYPGKYREAADALRQARREMEQDAIQ